MINKISSCGRITTEVKWPLVKLNEACSLNMGQSPDSSGYNDEGKGLPFYQGNADFGTLTPVTRLFCNNPTKIAHAGDILLSVRAPIGAVNIANQTCCIGRGLAALTAYRDVDVKFLYYAIKSKHGEFNAKGTGSTFKAINKKALYETRIPLPALAEQKNIANILDNVSNLISLCKKQIMQLDLLVKSRFIEMFGDPVENPKGWSVLPISSFAKVKIGPFGSSLHAEDYVSGGYPLVNPSHIIEEKIVPDEALTLSEKKYRELSAYHLELGDIVLGRRGEIGRCALVTQVGLFCGTGSMFVRIMKDCRPDFLQRVISHPTYKAVLEDKAVGGTMKNLNAGMIENSLVALPPLALQNEFAAFIEQLDKSKFTIRKSLEKLETLYRALLQEYFG